MFYFMFKLDIFAYMIISFSVYVPPVLKNPNICSEFLYYVRSIDFIFKMGGGVRKFKC